MPRAFLTDDAKAALSAAIRTLETRSSAELVVAVRPRSGTYLHVALAAGAAAALAALALLLFLPFEFGLAWILIDPLLAGGLTALLVHRTPALSRALSREAVRRERVETAARALFVEKRLHRTRARTGILFYVSLLERLAVLVPDVGIEPLADGPEWRQVEERIAEAMRRGADGVEVAGRLADLAAVLEASFPCPHDDVDELSNEVM